MASKKSQKTPIALPIILLYIVFVAVVFIAYRSLKHQLQTSTVQPIIKQKQSDNLPNATITSLDTNNKLISFPAYGIIFTIPSEYKTPMDIGSSYGHPTPNSIGVNTPDLTIDKGAGYPHDGAIIEISVQVPWIRFEGVNDLKPMLGFAKPEQITTDTSAIPTGNPVVSLNSARVFSFPGIGDSSAWNYFAQAKIELTHIGQKQVSTSAGITIECSDYAYSKTNTPSIRCRYIVKNLLSNFNLQ